MASTSRESFAAPLRRRTHMLNSSRGSFTSAGSSTVRAESEAVDQDRETLPSPPTSFVEEDEDADAEYDGDGEEQGSPGTAREFPRGASPESDADEDEEQDEEDPEPERRPWYKPSLPVVLALSPALGNWLTGGDYLKDLLLLILLIFYLHQLVELPWTLYSNARPRRSLRPSMPAVGAIQELRRLEILLLFICLVTPALGVVLLRSLTSTTPYGGTEARQPISWFSTSLFALLTGIRPLRELVSRVTTHTSTLHMRIHNSSGEADRGELAALHAEVAQLTKRLDALSQTQATASRKSPSNPQLNALTSRLDSLTALVSSHAELLPLLEDGVLRLERRVGKLRAGRKAQLQAQGQSATTTAGATANTIFVPAPASKGTRPLLSLSWLFPSAISPQPSAIAAQPPSQLMHLPPQPPPLSPSSSKRRAPLGLASIPEEGEPMPASYPPSVIPATRQPFLYAEQTQAHAQYAYGGGDMGGGMLELFAKLALAPIHLMLLPLYLVLLPVRGVLRALVK
ncbi:OTU domain-containing protein [Mycena kentingensis (nom. inval.)]|nr:OTU domain-containing protein [Mycena kentingensis (nom. inval.)]